MKHFSDKLQSHKGGHCLRTTVATFRQPTDYARKKKGLHSITKTRTLSRLKSPEIAYVKILLEQCCQSRSWQMMKENLTTGMFNF